MSLPIESARWAIVASVGVLWIACCLGNAFASVHSILPNRQRNVSPVPLVGCILGLLISVLLPGVWQLDHPRIGLMLFLLADALWAWAIPFEALLHRRE